MPEARQRVAHLVRVHAVHERRDVPDDRVYHLFLGDLRVEEAVVLSDLAEPPAPRRVLLVGKPDERAARLDRADLDLRERVLVVARDVARHVAHLALRGLARLQSVLRLVDDLLGKRDEPFRREAQALRVKPLEELCEVAYPRVHFRRDALRAADVFRDLARNAGIRIVVRVDEHAV